MASLFQFSMYFWYIRIVGVNDAEGPPVPISNTVVKLTGAENTWLATAWEDRLTPTQTERLAYASLFCCSFCSHYRKRTV